VSELFAVRIFLLIHYLFVLSAHYCRYRERVVWDKGLRMDLFFGSTPASAEVALSAPRSTQYDDSNLDRWSEYRNSGSLARNCEGGVGSGDDDKDNDDTSAYVYDTGDYKTTSDRMKIEDVITTYDQWLENTRAIARAKVESSLKTKVFCDLDGVLADFDAGVLKLFKKKPAEVSPKVLWPRLASTPGFYADLPWMPNGKQLWAAIAPLNPVILTGLPRGKWAEPQKREWCARELGAEVEVICCASKDKHKHCPPVDDGSVNGDGVLRSSAVLIDDREAAREPWEAAGGRFVLFTSTEDAISQLKALGLSIRADRQNNNELSAVDTFEVE
jgi:hypothetical protein